RAAEEPGEPDDDPFASCAARRDDTGEQACGRDDAVVGAEHGGTQPAHALGSMVLGVWTGAARHRSSSVAAVAGTGNQVPSSRGSAVSGTVSSAPRSASSAGDSIRWLRAR